MKTENEFNAYLSAALRKLEPYGVFALKVAEKYHIGISDLFIWRGGRCAAVEVKFVREMPRRNGKVLKHEFDGKQVTFLKRVAATGNPAWGMVAIHEERRVILIPFHEIPPDGNWQGSIPDCFPSYSYSDMEKVAYALFVWPEISRGTVFPRVV